MLCKYWDKFTPAQLDNLLGRLKLFPNLLGHGTENHALMRNVGGYLFAQQWPNETGWGDANLTSAELLQQARANLLGVMRSLYDKGHAENLSTVYLPVHLFALNGLYSCATDAEIKSAADAALTFHVANMAAVSDWRPPSLLSHLAEGDGIVPYELTSDSELPTRALTTTTLFSACIVIGTVTAAIGDT